MSSETTKNSLSTTRCFKISWIQKIEIYKTQARFYVIGSNLAENKFRILKIDRTEPYDLAVLDDCIDYNKYQITGILQSLNSAHGGSLIGKTGRKLLPSYTGFGIVGFVRLMEGYYLILITKRSMVADIGGNLVYKIEDTTMVYLPNNQVKIAHTDEWRYLKAFQTVDLSSNFYYSHSYDLTNTLQHNMLMLNDEQTENSDIPHLQPNEIRIDSDDSTGESWVNLTENELRDMKITDEQCRKDLSAVKRKRVAVNTSPCARYLWNKYLLEPMDFGCVSPLWGIKIIHGHIEQACVNVYGKLIYITLVARRSSRFAGTRFMKRGCNVTGDVANEVETEQMVHCACATSLRHTQMTSYVQHRGSVPVQWLQDITASVVPAKPPIVLSVDNPFYQTTGKHFQAMMKRYGSPLMVLNLVRKKEKRHRESVLGQEFKQALEYLNQFLPTEHRIEYFALDMAHQSRLPNSNLLARLADIAERSLQSTGIFQSKPALFKKTLDKDLRWRQLGGEHVRGFRIQTGVLRTNCVDCLDRTNSAQFVAGKSALAYQLFSLGVLPQPTVNFDTDVTRLYEEMFDQHGDIVALQYGGSQLVHTIQTYRRTVAPWTSHSRDIVTTLSRYYSNTFSDADKQSAINLFLGLYRPSTAPDPLWDLDTDHYLHNDDMQVLTSFALHDYVRWCFPKLIEILPLPYDTVTELNERRESREEGICHVTRTPAVNHCDDCCDWFDDFHRTNELTVFDDSLALQLANTLNRCISYGYSDPSPFAIRSENWQHWNRQQRLQSDSTASQSSNDVISSNESSDSDDNNLQAKPSSYDVTTENDTSPPWFKKPTLEDFSPQKVYGIDLDHATSAQDSRTFHEHLSYQVLLDDETSSGYNSDLESSIPSPIVDKQSLAMYRDSVAHNYKVDRDFYRDYLLQFSA